MSIKRFTLSAAAGLLLATAATSAYAGAYQAVVHDIRGNPVTDKRGNCVTTMWSQDVEECGVAGQYRAEAGYESPARGLKLEQRTVYFNFNKSTLTEEARQKLDYAAQVLKNSKDVKSARIVGHADRIGSAEYNEALSQRRARAVQDYLAKRGYLNTSVAQVSWVGENQSVTTCSEGESRKAQISCLQPDRRVEVQIEYLPNAQ